MDVVITYVNGLDPVWQKSYEKYTNTPILEKRFRDWGTLKYLFRGIEKNMPFIRKVHLVVSGESQVPEWVNRDEVNVVLHSDIIPAEYLPTFNCNPIEMHLHRIKDLDEEYLYFNDDMFPMRACKPTDFFRDGKGVIGRIISLLWICLRRYAVTRRILHVGLLVVVPRHSSCALSIYARQCLRASARRYMLRLSPKSEHQSHLLVQARTSINISSSTICI